MRSLKARLGSGLVVVLVLVFTLQWMLVSIAIRYVTEDYITARMSRDIDNLLAGLAFNSIGLPEILREPGDVYNNEPFSGHYYQIYVEGYILRSRSFWDQSLDILPVSPGNSATQRINGPLDQPLLVLSKGFSKQQRQMTISVAEDMSAVNAAISKIQNLYLAMTIALLLVLLLSQQWIVHRSMKSLTATRFDLERITRGEADKLPENVPAEIGPLVREINTLLDILAKRLVKTRTAVGNLAHALKTPLSLLTQLTNDRLIADEPQLQKQLRHQVDTIHLALERELNRARLAGDGKAGRRFDPAQDLPPLIKTLQRIYQDKSVNITLTVSGHSSWPADQEDMLELFGNLADNACKWARQQVSIKLCPDQYCFRVEDDGPGCPPDQIESLSQRGLRLDENINGHGLGLSIVRDIVNHYQGQLDFYRPADLGGLGIEVRIFAHQPD